MICDITKFKGLIGANNNVEQIYLFNFFSKQNEIKELRREMVIDKFGLVEISDSEVGCYPCL